MTRNEPSSPRPARCTITRIGLALLGLSVLCFATIEIAQYFKTGSFARGNGFVLGPYIGVPMLVALGAGLGALAVGGVVDSLRYGRWKKQAERALKEP